MNRYKTRTLDEKSEPKMGIRAPAQSFEVLTTFRGCWGTSTRPIFVTPHSSTAMLPVVLALVVFGWWFLLLRPRRGGKNAPPVVSSSPVVPIPLIGHLAEFFKSPNSMIKRCYEQIGPVFTIPVGHEPWVGVGCTELSLVARFSRFSLLVPSFS